MARKPDYDIWFDRFKPERNKITTEGDAPSSGCMYETYGAEHDYIRQCAKDRPNCVWTLVSGDDPSKLYITPGYHWVNRMGYFVTEVPFADEHQQRSYFHS